MIGGMTMLEIICAFGIGVVAVVLVTALMWGVNYVNCHVEERRDE